MTIDDLKGNYTVVTPGSSQKAPVNQPQGSSLADKIWSSLASYPLVAGAKTAVDTVAGNNPIGNVARSIVQPFASLAATPVQVLAKLINKKDPYANGVPLGESNLDISPLSVPAKTGDLLKAGSTIASTIVAPESIAGAALAGGGIGAAQGAGSALQEGKTKEDIVRQAAIEGGIGAVASGAISLLGHILQSTGDKIQFTSIKPSQADIKDGFSIDTVKKYDLGGSLDTVYNKTQSKLDELTAQLNQKLADSNASIDLASVYDDTAKAVSKNTLKQFGANTSIDRALNQLQDEVLAANPSGTLTIPEAQTIKQAAGRMGAWQYGHTDPEASAREVVYNTFYRQLKTAIENNSPAGIKEINKQLSELIPVANAVLRRIPVAERNSALSLTDMITATASIFDPRALVTLGISLAQKEGRFGNLLSKVAPKVNRLAVPGAAVTSEAARASGIQ